MTELEVALDGLAFPEGPRWHGGRLWFSDQHERVVRTLAAGGSSAVVVAVPNGPSGLGWLPDGRLLVVSMRDRRLLRVEADGVLGEVADLSALAPWHCNDMVVDPSGRAYVGNFGFDLDGGAQYRPTVLVLVEPEGDTRVAADDLAFPNGAVIIPGTPDGPDGPTLVVAETFGSRLTAFSVAADGSLSDRRTWAGVPGVYPDGICLDDGGGIWIADPGGRRVLRVLEGGVVTDELVVGGPNSAYACALGGDDGRTLFVCTAPSSDPDAALAARGGRIETATVKVPAAAPAL